jgi:hypothetical protein
MSVLSIVLVHGLTGHAWNTFVSSERNIERHWIRDVLPGRLQVRGIFPRIMTYGYNANIWRDQVVGRVTEPAGKLVRLLDAEREQVRDIL